MESEAHKQTVMEIADKMKGMSMQAEYTPEDDLDIVACDGKFIFTGNPDE
jgi:hypothetical protein